MVHRQNSSQVPKWRGLFREPVRHAFLCSAILIVGSLTAEPLGQQSIPNPMNQQSRSPSDVFGINDPVLAARQLRALNAERQKALVSDTEKLLRLAQELNSEIESSNQAALTEVQLRKIADIEKLARNVKQKMSISFVGGSSFEEPLPRQGR